MCQGVNAPFGHGVTVMLGLLPIPFRGEENVRMEAYHILPVVS